MKMNFLRIFLSVLLIITKAHAYSETPLNVVKSPVDKITVSGLSAGAFMAVQLQFAFSKDISGVAVVAGGLFYCAKNQMWEGLTKCMSGELSEGDIQFSIQTLKLYESTGLIDPLENVNDDKVFLFSGKFDRVVKTPAMEALDKFYTHFDVDTLEADFSFPAGHGFVTLDKGSTCEETSLYNRPWLLNCNRDLAKEILEKTLGRKLSLSKMANRNNLHTFNQRPYADMLSGMASTGHVYIPEACKEGHGNCSVHVALHGCDQTPETVGDAFIWHAGYNNWAESNNVIVLYPAITKTPLFPYNPMGCFDWWGYSGGQYATKKGLQMKAIMDMVDVISKR
ncbi:hypothetical protein M899_1726 [Bacteriovorax sp. BSW11_IV]|uniref:extracellular catalytic domain type 2 short-chain-length polyhydroxyalkanoate depolymerase n=1 Tax=Bacteriovorax sp. BSW11_IV TaxID=1353529 RepID=UPI00038A3364|nr:hypothetical protein [Bacteriovorax sp. BSW11_IV]EQC49470.1 hypothetical protein M899_1726 [Bacteriovorax sp. BSW11_IV]